MTFIASFFGVKAVAASAFLTLPLQAAVASYYISRPLAISLAEMFRSMLKSGIVTTCCGAAVLIIIKANAGSFADPIIGLLTGAAAGLAGWWCGLVMTSC